MNRQEIAGRLRKVTTEWNALMREAKQIDLKVSSRHWINWPGDAVHQIDLFIKYEETL